MAIAARKRFNISKKSVKNGIYSCPPLEGGSKSLISRRGTRAKRALNIVGIDKQNTGLIHVTNLFPYFLIPLFPLSERRLTHQFGTEWQNYINLILLKDNDKWRRNNITFVTNLFPYFLNPLFPLAKRPHAQNPCPIRLSARGGGGQVHSYTLGGR